MQIDRDKCLTFRTGSDKTISRNVLSTLVRAVFTL